MYLWYCTNTFKNSNNCGLGLHGTVDPYHCPLFGHLKGLFHKMITPNSRKVIHSAISFFCVCFFAEKCHKLLRSFHQPH